MSSADRLHVECPGCRAKLVVDRATGEIVASKLPERPLAGGHTLEGLMDEMEASRAAAEDRFTQEVAAQKDRERLLDEKFQEALKRAEEDPDDTPPKRPFDLD